MKEVAFGWLGVMPEIFYDMELEDFFLMQKGFFNKRKADSLQFANVAFCVDAIGTGLAGKRADYKRFVRAWFGEVEKPQTKEQLAERSKIIMDKLAVMQRIQDEKDARAIKNSN